MSCIAGCFAPGDNAAGDHVERMLDAMETRAPDGRSIFATPRVVIGQAFLRTGRSGRESPNALTLDHRTWLVADVRIDGRPELVDALRKKGRDVRPDAPDGELLLHAYAAFGAELVHHVIGDFAFAIWDADRGVLFCARDHFGIRPLYYAMVEGTLLFASDIDALVAVEGVPRDLDDRAVGETLLFGMCLAPERTIYSAIRALPGGCALEARAGSVAIRRWWTLRRGVERRRASKEEYVAEFMDVFRRAVVDRLPDGPVALQLSGGMDSTSIARVAADRKSTGPCIAYHLTARRVIPDDDEHVHARRVATHLGLTLDEWHLDETPLFAHARVAAWRTAQPMPSPHLAVHAAAQDAICAAGARVVLSGHMGDAVVSPHADYFPALVRQGRLLKLAREAVHHLALGRSWRGMGLRGIVPRGGSLPAWVPPMPDWIAPSLVEEHELRAVWDGYWRRYFETTDSIEHIALPWQGFEFRAAQALRHPLAFRYPFLDIRLIDYASGLPNALLVDKAILRQAMRGLLPDDIVARPKTAMPGDIVREMVTNGMIDRTPGSSDYVSGDLLQQAWKRYRDGAGSGSTSQSWLMMQAEALAHWLRRGGDE